MFMFTYFICLATHRLYLTPVLIGLPLSYLHVTVGWSTQQPQVGSQGFAQPYDAGYGGAGAGGGGGQGDLTVKMKLVNLIGAVRTLMRSEFLIIIVSGATLFVHCLVLARAYASSCSTSNRYKPRRYRV